MGKQDREENQRGTEAALSAEDKVFKVAASYFGKEFLPYLGVREKVETVMPTETIHLEARSLYQDFNYSAGKNLWIHLEFESDSIKTADLRRFREYEASVGRTYKVSVITYVVCTSKVKKLRSKLRTGINTYQVKIIRMKDYNADEILQGIQKRIETGSDVQKRDLVLAALSPLMSGKSSIKERIVKGLKLVQVQNVQKEIDIDETGKLQAVLYTLAGKFLGRDELQDVKEVIKMTLLGQMLREDGIQEGREYGIQEGVTKKMIILVCKKLQKNQDARSIAETLEENEDYIQKICEAAKRYAPNYDVESIYKDVKEEL